MRSAFVWCFVGSVLTQAARTCARCCRRSVLCGLLVTRIRRRGKKLLCAGRMIVIKIFPVGNAVLWMFSAGTSRKVGAGGKWQSEWSVLWIGGRHDETACKPIANAAVPLSVPRSKASSSDVGRKNGQRSRSRWMQMDCAVEQGGARGNGLLVARVRLAPR